MKYLLFIFWTIIPHILVSQLTVDDVINLYKKDKDLKHALYSVCILEAESGRLIKEYNSELALVPASTLKIVTTSAALGILGKDYCYKTDFFSFQKKDSSYNSLKNYLIIKGSGDPSFNSSYFFKTDSIFFSPIINALKNNNLNKINGSIIVDASCFDNEIPESWIWADIGNYYGANANSLSYHDNKFSIFYSSGEPNTKSTITSIFPNYFKDKLTIESDVIAFGTEDDAFVFGDPNGYFRKIKGYIPPHKKNYEVEAQMPNPVNFFIYELKNELIKNNIANAEIDEEITTNYLYSDKFKSLKLIYSHKSPSLEKLIYYTNIKSNNHYAESILKTIGGITSAKQGNTKNGILALENFWKERGIDLSGLHMEDGSGLSRANSITTKIQATVLSKIYKDGLIYPAFNNSLPIAGKNGSMANLCKGTFAENNLRAKTGYINRVRSYCGYVKTKSGKELAFSIIINNYDCSAKEMKLKLEKLLVSMVEL